MNIKNIKTYILSGILALSMSSCLDKYPEDSICMDQAINTVDDMDKLVYGIYDSFKSSALYSGNLGGLENGRLRRHQDRVRPAGHQCRVRGLAARDDRSVPV